MSDVSWHEDAAKQARILQVIVAALVMGCLFFLLVALTIGPVVKPARPFQPISLTMFACGLMGIEVIAQMVVASAIATKARRGIIDGAYKPVEARKASGQTADATYLLSVFQTKTIVSGALFEGVAFLSTIAYLIEANPIAVAVAVLMILGVAAQFPTQFRIIGWVERQFEAIGQEKMLK